MTKSRGIQGPRVKTEAGMTFAYLTLIALTVDNRLRIRRRWLCRCVCGKEVEVPEASLVRGARESCGCAHGKNLLGEKNPAYKHGHCRRGQVRPERAIWQGLIDRCYNPQNKGYRNYGARGISVCNEWRQSYIVFFEHVGPRPSALHSLDRIDNNGNYEPGNVRWVTRTEQNRNTRRTRLLTYNGLTLCIRDWEERLGFKEGTLQNRLDRGWAVEETLSTPLNPPRRKRAA